VYASYEAFDPSQFWMFMVERNPLAEGMVNILRKVFPDIGGGNPNTAQFWIAMIGSDTFDDAESIGGWFDRFDVFSELGYPSWWHLGASDPRSLWLGQAQYLQELLQLLLIDRRIDWSPARYLACSYVRTCWQGDWKGGTGETEAIVLQKEAFRILDMIIQQDRSTELAELLKFVKMREEHVFELWRSTYSSGVQSLHDRFVESEAQLLLE
jgi:hypothetical protein